MKGIHNAPKRYAHIERGCALMNMMIERGGLPEGWKVYTATRVLATGTERTYKVAEEAAREAGSRRKGKE